METKLERNNIAELHTRPTIGYPMTPGHWAGKEEYKDVTKITMTKFVAFIEKTSPETIADLMAANRPLTAKTFDGRTITLNLRYMENAEDFTMVTRQYESQNPNFPKGTYTCRWLLPLGETVTFVNRF